MYCVNNTVSPCLIPVLPLYGTTTSLLCKSLASCANLAASLRLVSIGLTDTMTFVKLFLFGIAAAAATGSGGSSAIDIDVAIIGGGASGAYAAVRLREDFGKSIAVVEKEDRLVKQSLPKKPYL